MLPVSRGNSPPTPVTYSPPVFAASINSWLLALAGIALAAALYWLSRRGPIKRWRRRLRTRRAERVWSREAVAVPRAVSSRVIVTLTASPGRMVALEQTVRTLLNQTCPPDEIHLNIPEVFRRTGERYEIPGWCSQVDPRVRLFRVEDIGPATKMVTTVERVGPAEDILLVIADDDTLYPQETIQALLEAHRDAPSTVHAVSGYDLGPQWESVLAKEARPVAVVEGWATFVAHRRHFGAGFAEHVHRVSSCRACFAHDDIVVSNWFALQGVDRRQIHHPMVSRRRFRQLGAQQDYGYLPGGLHQESLPSERARQCASHLASLGLWRLPSPPVG